MRKPIDLTTVPRNHLEPAYRKACGLIAHHIKTGDLSRNPDYEQEYHTEHWEPAHWESIILYEVRRTEELANETADL